MRKVVISGSYTLLGLATLSYLADRLPFRSEEFNSPSCGNGDGKNDRRKRHMDVSNSTGQHTEYCVVSSGAAVRYTAWRGKDHQESLAQLYEGGIHKLVQLPKRLPQWSESKTPRLRHLPLMEVAMTRKKIYFTNGWMLDNCSTTFFAPARRHAQESFPSTPAFELTLSLGYISTQEALSEKLRGEPEWCSVPLFTEPYVGSSFTQVLSYRSAFTDFSAADFIELQTNPSQDGLDQGKGLRLMSGSEANLLLREPQRGAGLRQELDIARARNTTTQVADPSQGLGCKPKSGNCARTKKLEDPGYCCIASKVSKATHAWEASFKDSSEGGWEH